MSRNVNVIGDSLIDINFDIPKQFVHRYEQLLKIELPFGDKLSVDNYNLSPGGSGANVAAGLSKTGLKVRFQTGLGDDIFASFLKDFLRNDGISLEIIDTDLVTVLSVIFRVKGERTIVSARPGPSPLPADLPGSGWLHLGPLHGDLSNFFNRLISHQVKTGQQVSINPSMETLEERPREFLALLKTTEVLIINFHEAVILSRMHHRHTPSDIATQLLRMGPKVVCLTDGERGAYVVSENFSLFSPALTDQYQRVDATGAGDAFATGFLSGYISYQEELTRQELLSRSLAFATLNASSVVSSVGAHAGLLSISELLSDENKVKIKDNNA